jgi:hypothetical protein
VSERRSWRGLERLVAAVAVALVIAPVLIDLLVRGRRRAFSYFAADAFYYLQVARSWADHGKVSFDGTRATNGFHPLWQIVLAAIWRPSRLVLSEADTLVLVVVLGAVLLGVATVLLARALHDAGWLTPWFVALPFGAYALLIAPVWAAFAHGVSAVNPLEGPMPLYGTAWSYANGMESACVWCAFAWLLAIGVRRAWSGWSTAAWLGAAAAALGLARLDTAAVSVGVLVAIGIAGSRARDREAVRTAVGALAGLVTVLVAYVVVNRVYAGAWLPISGTLKSHFPHPSSANWRDLWSLVRGNHLFARLRLYRALPTLLPAVIAAGHLVVIGLRSRGGHPRVLDTPAVRFDVMLAGTAGGVLAIAAYDELFVPSNFQGHWYWPVSTLYVSIVALRLLAKVKLSRVAVGLSFAGATALSIGGFVGSSAPVAYHQRFADFYFDVAPGLRARYAKRPPHLFAYDDGLDAFALGWPALSANGLMLDSGALGAAQHERLLALGVRRGFTTFSSVQYLGAQGLSTSSSSDTVRARLQGLLPGEDLSPYDFRVVWRSDPGALYTQDATIDNPYVLIAITPRR